MKEGAVFTRAKKALQKVHREYLMKAMQNNDIEYIDSMNAAFRLLERLEKEANE
jgi:hypothetical protein